MAKPFDFGTLNAKDMSNPWAHWFFYGATGSGKTTLCATFPRPVFLVPFNEQSITTLRGRSIPYYVVTDKDETKFDPKTGRGSMNHILDHLIRGYDRDPNAFPFDTIVIESISHYADLVQEQLTRGGQKMDQQKWGFFLAHFRNIQARLRNIEVHVVFTALDRVEKDDGGQYYGGPLIPGQTGFKLPSACDVIGYCEEVGGEYKVHFRKRRHFRARSRLAGVPPVVKNFNFQEIEKLIGSSTKPNRARRPRCQK